VEREDQREGKEKRREAGANTAKGERERERERLPGGETGETECYGRRRHGHLGKECLSGH